MSKTNDGGSAFPKYPTTSVPVAKNCDDGTKWINEFVGGGHGMSLRDYFAAAVMQGWMACPSVNASTSEAVKYCYEVADAMLAERERGDK